MKLSNEQNIGLSTAVFLASDEYDYDPRPNALSATTVIKPPRQVILSRRVDSSDMVIDISRLVAARSGNAIHDAIEKAWSDQRYIPALRKLGYAESMIKRIVVNPDPVVLLTPEQMADPERPIPVYLERRSDRELDGFIIRGKFDFVGDGILEDHKTTGVFSYMKPANHVKYRLQGSIYRWLNPDIITADYMMINFTFTDWSKLRAKIERASGYPQQRMLSMQVPLLSMQETEQYLRGQIRSIVHNLNKPEPELPLCTQEELWQDPTVYKYYKNPALKERSTKNFSTFAEAQARLIKDGSTGVVDICRGMAKACLYCSALPICTQAQQLIADGLLEV